MADVTREEIIKLVREYGALKQMYGYGASPKERLNHHRNAEATLEKIIAALASPTNPSDVEAVRELEMAVSGEGRDIDIWGEGADGYERRLAHARAVVLARMRGARSQ